MKVTKDSRVFIDIDKFNKAFNDYAVKNHKNPTTIAAELGIARGFTQNMRANIARFCKAEKLELPDKNIGSMSKASFCGYCSLLGLNVDDYTMTMEEAFARKPATEEPSIQDEPQNNELLDEIRKMNTNLEALIHAVNSIGKLASMNVDNTHNILMNTRQLMANTKELKDILR